MTNDNTFAMAHDEHLLDLLQEQAKADTRLGWASDTLRHIAGQVKSHQSRTVYTWRMSRTDHKHATVQDAVDTVVGMVEAGDAWVPQYSGKPSKYLAEYEQARFTALDARDAVKVHEALYTGWERYWLVVSSANGHIHHHNCSSFRPTTSIALLPSLSGATPAAAVAALGPALCSKCFKDAPTEWVQQAKIPSSVSELLLTQGEPAFQAALATWQAKQAAKAVK